MRSFSMIRAWMLLLFLSGGCRLVMDIPDGPPVPKTCGDGEIQTGETCDGIDLGAKTCEDLGFGPGVLVCNASCTGFITEACSLTTCGDGEIQTGETCDGIDLGAKTCEDLGFGPGVLVCNASCTGFITEGCGPTTCGDGEIQTSETCDGANLGGATCESLGYYPGTLSCLSNCSLDVSGCGGACGDGVKQNVEACDGTDLAGSTCRSSGYFTGELACKPTCNFDENGCRYAEMIEAGEGYACTILNDASLRCWGANGYGQLGDGTTTDRTSPAAAALPFPVLQVAPGYNHTCVLRDDRSVWCWGNNDRGQLGDGTATSRLNAAPVNGLAGVTHISAGTQFTCAVAGGSVYCWGGNSSGELGIGTISQPQLEPQTVQNISSAVEVSAGWYHACARMQVGGASQVACWGMNSSGQLGDGTTTDRTSPVAIANLSSVIKVEAGTYHTCALQQNGSVWCWGDNEYGQLGDGSTTQRKLPAAVSLTQLPSLPVDIAAGGSHSCAILADGSAACWGYNYYGQLGDGTMDNRTRPTPVRGSNGLSRIAARGNSTCALNQVGRLWCWGDNGNGQLGDGTTTDRTDPVEVLP